jgi:hypothetical protein
MLAGMKEHFSGSRPGKRPRRSKAAWVEEVVRWRQSEQSASEYAREHGLHAGTLTVWGSKLRGEQTPKRRAARGQAAGFLPVRVVEAAQPSLAVERGRFEVVLRNGRRVVVSGEFGSEALTRLLDIAEGSARC